MTTYNTGNAIGSSDPRDLYDNAENLDNFANGPANTYPDRLGVTRKSLAGMRSAFDDFLQSSGYTVPAPYAAGIALTAYNQLIEYNDEFYKLKAGQAPYTTTGTWGTDSAKLVAVGDAALRQELTSNANDFNLLPEIANYAALDAYTGDVTAFYVRGVANIFDGGHGVFRRTTDTPAAANGIYRQDALGRWWQREFSGPISTVWFGSRPDPGFDGNAIPIQAAIDHCALAGGGIVETPAGNYHTTAKIALKAKVAWKCAGREKTFLTPVGSFNAIEVHGASRASWLNAAEIHGLTILGSGCTGRGLSILYAGLRCKFSDLYIQGINGIGMYIEGSFDQLYENIEIRGCSSFGLRIYEKQTALDGVFEEVSWLMFIGVDVIGNNSGGVQVDCAGGNSLFFDRLKPSEGSVGIDFSRNCQTIHLNGVMCDGRPVPEGSGTSVVVRTSTDFCQDIHINDVRAWNCQHAVQVVRGRRIYIDNASKVSGVAGDLVKVEDTAVGPVILGHGVSATDADANPVTRTTMVHSGHRNASNVDGLIGTPMVQTIQHTFNMTAYAAPTAVNVPFPTPFPTACLGVFAVRDGIGLLTRFDGGFNDVLVEASIQDRTSCNLIAKLAGNVSPNSAHAVKITVTAFGY